MGVPQVHEDYPTHIGIEFLGQNRQQDQELLEKAMIPLQNIN
jgi:hypothetical protein